MNKLTIQESYGRFQEDNRQFDIKFWQEQGPVAIFEAAYGMIKDYLLLRNPDADKPRLSRTTENFQKK